MHLGALPWGDLNAQMQAAEPVVLLQECVFNPRLESKQLAKEGKALKLAATMSMCRRGQVRSGQPLHSARLFCMIGPL